jgi:integrase
LTISARYLSDHHAGGREVTGRFCHPHGCRHRLPPVRLHDLRHGAATLAQVDNVPVNIIRAVMGHESTSITLNLYTRAPNEFEDRVRGVFDDSADDSLTE